MTPSEYVALAMRTKNDLGEKNNIAHAAAILSSESGEIMSEVKRMFEYNIKEELGDLMWGIALMCDTLGFTLEEVMTQNIAKLKARYPEGYTDHAAIHRDVSAEQEAMARN